MGRGARGLRQEVALLTGVCTALHFLVDGLCICCIYLLADSSSVANLLGVFITYNVLAFLTQPLTGMLADRLRPEGMLLAAAIALLAIGVAVAFPLGSTDDVLPLYIVAVLLGLGNSLFHVWGGRLVTVSTGNDIRALGVFVSTGAFGLVVGILFHSRLVLVAFLLAIAALAFYALRLTSKESKGQESLKESQVLDSELNKKPVSMILWLAVLALMGIVMLRSLLGETFSAGIAKGGMMILAIGAVAMIGKIAGGFLSHWMGIVWAMLLVVAGIVACLLLPSTETVLFIGLLLVNCTMAVTLYLVNAVLPGREGLAFGLLAAALMPGYLLAQADAGGMMIEPLLLTLIPTIVIELIVLWALRERRGEVLGSSVVVNILTNVPLHLFVVFVSNSLPAIIVGEVLVVLVEMLWYRYFVDSWRKAFIYSFLCNGFSLLAGLLLQCAILLLLILNPNT